MKKLISEKMARERFGGLSRASFWELERSDPQFPKKIRIGKKRKGYLDEECDNYVDVLVERRNKGVAQ